MRCAPWLLACGLPASVAGTAAAQEEPAPAQATQPADPSDPEQMPRRSLELRAELFNATNTPPLGNPNGIFGTPAFGTITSAGAPRVIQLAVKVHF